AVIDHAIAVLETACGKLEGTLDQLLRGEAGLQHVDVEMDLLPGQAIELALLRRRLARAAEISAREIGAIAVGTDQVGVEADQLARADDAVAGFRKPGIGAA